MTLEVWRPRAADRWAELFYDADAMPGLDLLALARVLARPDPIAGKWDPLPVYVSDVKLAHPDVWSTNLTSGALVLNDRARAAVEANLEPWEWLEFLELRAATESFWLVHFLRWPNVLDVEGSSFAELNPSLVYLAKPSFHRSRFGDQSLFPVDMGKGGRAYLTLTAHDTAGTWSSLKDVCEQAGLTGLRWDRVWDEHDGGVVLDPIFESYLP